MVDRIPEDHENSIPGLQEIGAGSKSAFFANPASFDLRQIGTSLNLGRKTGILSASGPLGEQSGSRKGGSLINWSIPRYISMDHDFYKLLFLNLEGEAFKISSVQVLLGFQRYLELIGRRFSKEVARNLVELQNEDKLIEWEAFLEYMHSCEAKARFRGISRTRASEDSDFSFEKVTCIALSPAERAFLTIEDGTTSAFAAIYSFFRLLVIAVSVLFIVMESCPSLKVPPTCSKPPCTAAPAPPDYFLILQLSSVGAFTFDYLLRVSLSGFVRHELMDRPLLIDMSAGRRRLVQSKGFLQRLGRYMIEFLCLADLASIVPFYVELVLGTENHGLQVFRVIRLISVLRLLRVKDVRDIQLIMSRAFSAASATLVLLFSAFLVMILFFSVVIYYAECGEWYPMGTVINGVPLMHGGYYRLDLFGQLELTPFYSVPAALYWAVITATTVGYGDITPTSEWGRLVACILAILGIVVLAMPIAVIGSNFAREHDRYFSIKNCLRLSKEKELQKRLMNKLMTDWNLNQQTATAADQNNNGLVPSELIESLKRELSGGKLATDPQVPQILDNLNKLLLISASNENPKPSQVSDFLSNSFDLLEKAKSSMSEPKFVAVRALLIDVAMHISRSINQ